MPHVPPRALLEGMNGACQTGIQGAYVCSGAGLCAEEDGLAAAGLARSEADVGLEHADWQEGVHGLSP